MKVRVRWAVLPFVVLLVVLGTTAQAATFAAATSPTCTFEQSLTASPAAVQPGQTFTLSWCDPSYFNSADNAFSVGPFDVYFARSLQDSFTFFSRVNSPGTSIRITADQTDIGTLYFVVKTTGCQSTIAGGCPPNTPTSLTSNIAAVTVGTSAQCQFDRSLSATPTTVPLGQPFVLRWCDPSFTTPSQTLQIDSYYILFAPSPTGPWNVFGQVSSPNTALQLVPTSGDEGVTYFKIEAWGCRGGGLGNAAVACANATKQLESNVIAENVTEIFTAHPASIAAGQATTLTWSAPAGSSVSIDNAVGAQPSSGSVTVTPSPTTTYTLTARTGTQTITAKVTVDVLTAPRPVIDAFPRGMIAQPGAGGASDVLGLRNIGGSPATVVLNATGTFFSVRPTTATIAPGARAEFQITATAQPAGGYNGRIDIVSGNTTVDSAKVSLVVATPPAGTVAARATDARTLVVPPGPPVISPAPPLLYNGSTTFRNDGSATLTGTVVADAKWIIPPPDVIAIAPGQSRTVTFTVDPSLLAPASREGETATLSLVFAGTSSGPTEDGGTSKQSSSATVTHTTRTEVSSVTVPTVQAGLYEFVFPGITHFGPLITDLVAQRRSSSEKASDVALYYQRAGVNAAGALGAPFPAVAPSTLLALSDVLGTTFDDTTHSGTIHVQTPDPNGLSVVSNLLQTGNAAGLLGTVLPAIRSDRGVTRSVLAGLNAGSPAQTNLYVQEVAGSPVNVKTSFLAPNGSVLSTRTDAVAAYSVLEQTNVPSSATTALVTVDSGAGRIVTRALAVQSATGDVTDVTDWAARNAIGAQEAQVIPYVARQQTLFGAQRTELVLFNDSATAVNEVVTFNSSSPGRRHAVRAGSANTPPSSMSERSLTVSLAPQETRVLGDVLSDIETEVGAGSLTLSSPGSPVKVSARLRTDAAAGALLTPLPVVSSSAALRISQSADFGGVEDAATPSGAPRKGTFRASLAIVETDGKSTTARVTIHYTSGTPTSRAVVRATASKDYTLKPNGVIYLPDITRELIGQSRDKLQDLHGAEIDVTVTGGDGAVVPVLLSTELASGDVFVRSE